MIYFIQDEETLAVKIGHTTNPVEQRLRALQTASPGVLRLLGVVAGDQGAERELHETFGTDRLRGEWFRPSPDLMLFLLHFAREEHEVTEAGGK